MIGVNHVALIGNLGADPECAYTSSGTGIARMRLALNERFKNSEGQIVERVEWVNIVAFAGLAEVCKNYLKKGARIYADGKLHTRKWQDKAGSTHYSTEVIIEQMRMLDGWHEPTATEEKT